MRACTRIFICLQNIYWQRRHDSRPIYPCQKAQPRTALYRIIFATLVRIVRNVFASGRRLAWHEHMLREALVGIIIACSFTDVALAQTNTCGIALQQLQMYVAQVNQTAQLEFQQGIRARCGPNPMCAQALLQQLNFWYAQQANMVNNYYMQISTQCSSGGPTTLPQRSDTNGLPRVSEHDVKTLDVDDEDRTVRIRIPRTPQGFSPQ